MRALQLVKIPCHQSFALDLNGTKDSLKTPETMHKVLFLCTGNYYRSRFAQALFNHLAQERGLNWEAFSRGLWLQPEVNPGTLSIHTERELKKRGLALELAGDLPRPLTVDDILAADHIYALKEAEHRPLMQRDFPTYVDRVTYWKVHDLDAAGPEEALPQIERLVHEVLDEIAASQEGKD